GRGNLASANFEDAEAPSAIRQRRRSRTDSPGPAGLLAATVPPPHAGLELPTPSRELSDTNDSGVSSQAELASITPRPKLGKARWVLLVGGIGALALLATFLFRGGV